jgi:hypothetical protein
MEYNGNRRNPDVFALAEVESNRRLERCMGEGELEVEGAQVKKASMSMVLDISSSPALVVVA